MGVHVNNHVVYGDCEIILREHWSWDTHGWITKFKHSSNWLPQDGFPHNKLTSYKIPSGGHGQCKVTTYSNGDYGGSSTVLQNGWVPERGTAIKDIRGGGDNADSIHIDNGYMYSFDANGRTLRQWSKDSKKLATQACGKNMYEQALFGVSGCLPKNRPRFAANSNSRQYRPGDTRSTAFCAQVKNMPVVVDDNTKETCYDKLSSAALKKSKGIAFCKKDPTHARCKCINVARTDFIEHCKRNKTLPGCKEIVEGVKQFEDAGLMSATGLFGNPDCIVPSICSGDVYEPTTGMPACANKLAICKQVLELEDIKAAAGVKAVQACNINFEAEQKKKDDAKQAAKDKAAKDKAQAAKDKAQAAEDEKKKREELIEAAVAAAKEENKSMFTVPETIFGYSTSDEGNQKKALGGVGGVSFVSVSCCCLMIVLLAG
ncbi:MAG: hypothetical protein CMB57_06770 [Euryarchaeota archaeon]|nr:hypothetical protein [Euryarchaeota archaeon]